MSDDPVIAEQDTRKRDIGERVRTSGGESLAIYAADKIARVRGLRLLIARGTEEAAIASRKRRYEKSLVHDRGAGPESRLGELLRFELEAFAELPTQASGWE